MKTAIDIFRRAIVWDYYRKNTLFILAVILFAFGFLRGQEHIALAKQITGSSKMLFYVFILWLLYGVKTYLFVLRSLSLPEFRFLFFSNQLRAWQRISIWLIVFFLLNQLTFLYAAFLIIVGVFEGRLLASSFILMAQAIIILIGILVLDYRIKLLPEIKHALSFSLPIRVKFRIPFVLFYHK
jgi:hypothetical protein